MYGRYFVNQDKDRIFNIKMKQTWTAMLVAMTKALYEMRTFAVDRHSFLS